MSSQPVEANVVLTADNSAYDQAMIQSAGSTNDLGRSIDSLGAKINNLSKSAGKKLLTITAADTALVTSFVAAWNSYEKQMSRLQAQSAILTRTQDSQSRVIKDYTAAVKGLRTEYGTTTAEASKLVETLSKVTDIRRTRGLQDLSKVFVDMSHATGESSEGLASSLTNLQKVMGQPINERNTRRYADMFTYLSAQTNTSAQGLIDFTAQLSPMAEAMGMNTRQVAGFATAFTRAGQTGLGASNVFAKITSDITNSIATGSPELKSYANLVGLTAQQFKDLAPNEQVLRIFDQLSTMKPGLALAEMQRLGLGSIREQRALTAVAAQPGGIRAALGLATGGAGAAAEGAEASTRGLNDEMSKLRENLKMTGEEMGSSFGPAVEIMLRGLVKVTDVIEEMAGGPVGKFAQLVMAVIAPLTAGGGALLLFAGTLLKVAAAFTAVRNSMALGVREGFRGGAGIVRMPDGTYAARGEGMLGPRGAQLAQGPSTLLQRSLYNIGQAGGVGIAGATGGVREMWMQGRERWDPNYQRPVTSRGPMSFLAGGMGRGMQMFLTAPLDQMRYEDPTRRFRSRLFGYTPTPEMVQAREASSVAREQARTAGAVYESVMGTQGASPQMQDQARRDMHRANQQALAAEAASKRLTNAQNEAAAGTRMNVREMNNSTTGFRRLGSAVAGFAGGAGGAMWGGAIKPGFRGLMASGMAPQIGAGVGMAAMGAAGVQSNTAMLGALGTMILPGWGTGVGLAAGAAMDMAQANNDAGDSIKYVNEQATEAASSGVGLAALDKASADAKEKVDDLQKSFTGYEPWGSAGFIRHPIRFMGTTKNIIEGMFGTSDIDELKNDLDTANDSMRVTEQTVRDLGDALGEEFTGTRANQLRQMEEFMSTKGAAALAAGGIDFSQLVAARRAGQAGGALSFFGGEGTYNALLGGIRNPYEASGLEARMRSASRAGQIALDNPEFVKAITTMQGDISQQYKAINTTIDAFRTDGMTNRQILRQVTRQQAEIGVTDDPAYKLYAAIAGRIQQQQAIALPTMTRAQGLRTQVGAYMDIAATAPTTGPMAEQAEAMRTNAAQAFGEQMQYFQQLLLAQQQYEVSRRRAQEDYNLQRTYQEQDYQISRARAEQSFAISRQRAEENFQRMRDRQVDDFHRNERRAYFSYNLQRRRAEEDFNHQVQVMAEQQAASVYDIYHRVQTERTSSASWILSNAQDQLTRMTEQSENLDRARAMGLSNQAIQQLGLSDPQHAQQLARLLTELTPQMIAEFNKTAGTARVKAAKDLFTDPASIEWREMRRGFRLQMDRMGEDFERQMRQSRQDFRRGLRQQRDDFNIMMEDQAEDFHRMMRQQEEDYTRSVNRQEKAYQTQMDRAAEDMANMANEINMSLEEVLETATEKLSGHAKKQAEAALAEFKKLRTSTNPEAIALMKDLASIFGFEYKVPKGVSNNASGGGRGGAGGGAGEGGGGGGGYGSGPGYHAGGVVPGWTPGRDTQMVPLSGGEAIMRPEWARAVGEKTIESMNHRARHGGFWLGGVMPLTNASVSSHGSAYNYPAYDLNYPGYADYGQPIHAWKAGTVARMVYMGDQSYGRYVVLNHPGGQNTWYAHMSRFGSEKVGQSVGAGDVIGYVGDLGNTGTPPTSHLHFEIRGGSVDYSDDTGVGGGGGGGATKTRGKRIRLRSILKDLYPQSEKSALAMTGGVHPLFPGDISKVINRAARQGWRNLIDKYGRPYEEGTASGAGDDKNAPAPPPPANLNSNQEAVRKAMLQFGWRGQWPSLYQLVMHESGFNNTAQNPTSTAYGMFQFLDSTWAGVGGHKTSDPWLQSIYGMRYIKNRYTDPNGAWNFWQRNHWYGDGAMFDQPNVIGVGERGPEAVIPLNARGGQFMADVMGHVMQGRNVARTGGGLTVYNTRVDRSTTFTGAITVQASNPQELVNKLQARQRVMALSRPGTTTSGAAA